MSKQITIRDDLYERLKTTKDPGMSFSEIIDNLFSYRQELLNLQEATITQEGRITKTLAGKTILYRIKQEYAKIDTTTANPG